jgi:hypothetical protein
MPSYSYRNKKTGEEFTLDMSISEMEKYETDNPQLERQYSAVGIVDPVGIGVTRPPSDFSKYVLGKIKAANPHTKIGTGRWDVKKEI